MNHDNQYQDYSYQTYDEMSVREPGLLETIFGIRGARRIKNPIVATFLLLILGGGLAYGVMSFYGDDADVNKSVPIVKADAQPFKVAPDDRQGMEIANEGSTVFQPMQNEAVQENGPVEDLLANEQPVDDLEKFAAEAENLMENADEKAAQVHDMTKPRTDSEAQTAEAPSPDVKTAREIVIGNAPVANPPQRPNESSSNASASSQTRPDTINKPGTSPETLAFVRSVLDESQGNDTVSDIEPAAGNATAKVKPLEPGSHYVQVGSVRSETGADSEWKRIQKDLSMLDGLSYRVQSADLGERGTFYRIQAGPMSKDSANTLCDTIKSQKPNGCLVVR